MAAALLLLVVAAIWFGRDVARERGGTTDLSAQPEFFRTLREAEARFPEVDTERELVFPADHGAHPMAGSEVWDLAGWLQDAAGRDYTFRFSIARLGLSPTLPQRSSHWAAAAVYRGLFGLAADRGFRFRERFGRDALGMAGFAESSGSLWLDGWELRVPRDATGDFLLAAGTDGLGLNLRLRSAKPSPPAGDAGAGPNLRTYADTRLTVTGDLSDRGSVRTVTGTAWLDRAWGRLVPAGGQVALDRLRLQLDDGRELALLRLRRRDGSSVPVVRGVLIDAAGRHTRLDSSVLELTVTEEWKSPATGNRYPVGWRLRLRDPGLELTLTPLVEDQETRGTLTAWMGGVRLRGRATDGTALGGRGYVDIGG